MTTGTQPGPATPAAEAVHYSRKVEEICAQLETRLDQGLAADEAANRLATHGPNRLPEPAQISPLRLFAKQFMDFMVLILIGATILSLAMRDYGDAVVIAIVVVANAVIGFFQEYKAERTLASMREMAGPEAHVLRERQVETIPAVEVVPGDIVFLDEGNQVPADIRLAEVVGLEIEESVLTGESLPVEKGVQVILSRRVPLGDRRNMAFMGTVVTAGRGKGIAVATGRNTQIGRIADALAIPSEKPTPLQIKLAALGRLLVLVSLALCALIAAIGLIQGRAVGEVIMTAVSLAVAVIPEGLVAVVTVTMAVGVQRMARRSAIVRRLPAVETLGSVTAVCSDKTGTLTEGRMVATDLWVAGDSFTVTGTGIRPAGEIQKDGETVTAFGLPLELALMTAALCNNAVLQEDEEQGWEVVGDASEAALQVLASKAGRGKAELAASHEFLTELPFDSQRKRMSVIYEAPEERVLVLTKGAPEAVLAVSTTWQRHDSAAPLDDDERHLIEQANSEMAGRGLRVLGLAWRTIGEYDLDVEPEDVEHGMTFIGLVGLSDPPRPEAAASVERASAAGIRVHMITGDHQATAAAIAGKTGILDPRGTDGSAATGVLAGQELDLIPEQALAEMREVPAVFARVSPENKLKIVRALRSQGQIVAMTGDGVNDAPAIKHANVGVAMGRTGSDVTKQAADIILTDDNFATIIAAVEEGRRILDNIQKFIIYLLSCNVAEIFLMLFTMAAGMPLPLTPIQILWLNLVTDTPPALALGVDPPDHDIMRRPPRNPRASLFPPPAIASVLVHGLAMSLITLAVFVLESSSGGEAGLARARTMAFATLALVQLVHAFNARHATESIFRTGVGANHWLLAGVALSTALLLFGIYHPFLNRVFGQEGLALADWKLAAIGVAVFMVVAEVFKLVRRRARW